MEHGILGNPGQDIRDPNIVSKIENGKIVTRHIHKDALPRFLKAASATGFEVKKIADEGEDFPTRRWGYDNGNLRKAQRASYGKATGKDWIAVSIERPEGSIDHALFWDRLEHPGRKKV